MVLLITVFLRVKGIKGKVKYIEIPPRERTAQQGGGYERVTGAFDQCL